MKKQEELVDSQAERVRIERTEMEEEKNKNAAPPPLPEEQNHGILISSHFLFFLFLLFHEIQFNSNLFIKMKTLPYQSFNMVVVCLGWALFLFLFVQVLSPLAIASGPSQFLFIFPC